MKPRIRTFAVLCLVILLISADYATAQTAAANAKKTGSPFGGQNPHSTVQIEKRFAGWS